LKALKSNNTTEDKKSKSIGIKSNDHIYENSKTVLPVHPAWLRSAVDQYPQSRTEQLQELVPSERGVNKSYEDDSHSAEEAIVRISPAINIRRKNEGIFSFSDLDKKLLKSLLYSGGTSSSLTLSRKLEIPYSTIWRRRKRLENQFLEKSCSLRLDRLGWRMADLLVSTHKGRSSIVGKEMLDLSSITMVRRTIGEHTIDLHAEIVFKNNKELSNAIEWIKSIEGVKEVVWTEPVETVGRNTSIQNEIIDNHN